MNEAYQRSREENKTGQGHRSTRFESCNESSKNGIRPLPAALNGTADGLRGSVGRDDCGVLQKGVGGIESLNKPMCRAKSLCSDSDIAEVSQGDYDPTTIQP